MNLIVNVSKNWAIGKGNKLLVHLSEDMKFFKSHTIGNTIIMGRKTLESFPSSKPLPNRENIVLSRNPEYAPEGVTVYDSVEKFISEHGTSDNIYVIGGETVYRALLPYCKTAYVTKVDAEFKDADAFMPNLDDLPEWEIESIGEEITEKDVTFRFVTYKNLSLK